MLKKKKIIKKPGGCIQSTNVTDENWLGGTDSGQTEVIY